MHQIVASLAKEFQGRSYDLLVSHTTIVFSRYILLAWRHRQSTDARSFGGLFYLLCDEVGTLDWAVALQQLLDLIHEVATKVGKSFRLSFNVNFSNGFQLCPTTSRLVCRFRTAKVELMKSDGDDSCLKCIVSELSAVAVSQTGSICRA